MMNHGKTFVRTVVALALAIASASALAGSITADSPPVDSLADGRTGTIAFAALTPKGQRDFVARKVAERSTIAGVLALPAGAKAPGAAKVPAMVVVHGSSGVLKNDWDWAARMNGLGYASFTIDNFTGRGIVETATDQSRLSPMADVAGALAALRLLATHPAIDAKRIGVIGFSRGGLVAVATALDPLRRAVIDGELRFAAHVGVYVGCGVSYISAQVDGSPMLMLLGGKDDYTPPGPCLAYADALRARGEPVSAIVYPNAYHGFDSAGEPHWFPKPTTARKCSGQVDLDSGTFAMKGKDGQVVTGAAATEALKDCTEHGVTMGGDPQAREQAPLDAADFLKAAFGAK